MKKGETKCSFCDSHADSKEHIIPRWLQKHFNLKDQQMHLWNGTKLKYSQGLIPACKYCNSERFSKLENKVRKEEASLQEYYLWALKIRYGLALKDSSLKFDRKDPNSENLISKFEVNYGSTFIKSALKALDNPSFQFKPNPFGSVFFFEQADDINENFNMIDVPPPYWALSITLPSNKILMVLFADRGIVKKCFSKQKENEISNDILNNGSHSLNPITFSILTTQNHLKIKSDIRFTENGIFAERIPKRIKIRKQQIQWYYEIAYHCGLNNAFAKKVYEYHKDKYQNLRSIRCA
ncbi:hypothetical protein AB2B38_005960 [Balneola sp. MJW-20]|uniref:hypothetical protein n=1 Tax=Gracilimonas aurantiaca TaxID=3234185 RepID=UPI0034654D3A